MSSRRPKNSQATTSPPTPSSLSASSSGRRCASSTAPTHPATPLPLPLLPAAKQTAVLFCVHTHTRARVHAHCARTSARPPRPWARPSCVEGGQRPPRVPCRAAALMRPYPAMAAHRHPPCGYCRWHHPPCSSLHFCVWYCTRRAARRKHGPTAPWPSTTPHGSVPQVRLDPHTSPALFPSGQRPLLRSPGWSSLSNSGTRRVDPGSRSHAPFFFWAFWSPNLGLAQGLGAGPPSLW